MINIYENKQEKLQEKAHSFGNGKFNN